MLQSAQAAAEAAPRVPAAIVRRVCIFNGLNVVKIKVPADAKPGLHAESGLRYLNFRQTLPGGVLNFFVHSDAPADFIGKRIAAKVEVWRKDLDNGLSYLYLDFKEPVRLGDEFDAVSPTHRVAVMPGRAKDYHLGEMCRTFETPGGIAAVVILAPPKMQIVHAKGAATKWVERSEEKPAPALRRNTLTLKRAGKPSAAQKKETASEKSKRKFIPSQLQRLLHDGWHIDAAHLDKQEGQITLFKLKGGKRKEIPYSFPARLKADLG